MMDKKTGRSIIMNHTQEKVVSLRWAIGLSSLLALLKTISGLTCSSATLLASALDSLMDTGVSSVNYLSVRKASKPPDDDHAYGHEKIESLASYTQGIIIFVFAFLILGDTIRRTWARNIVFHSEVAVATIILSAVINLFLTSILHRAGSKTDSLILKAEKAHYSMDILSYAVILVALLLVKWSGWSFWDLLGGVLLAIYVAYLAARILLQAGSELVDRSLAKRALDELDTLIRKQPGVLSYHQMRTRKAGAKTFIDFHLVLEPEQTFEEAHEITESLIEKIGTRFENADITVHEDPRGGR